MWFKLLVCDNRYGNGGHLARVCRSGGAGACVREIFPLSTPSQALTKDGRPCKAPPTEGSLCYFHANPDRVRQLGQIGGRKNRQRTIDPSGLVPLSPGAVREMLAQVTLELRANTLSPRSATALAQVSSVLLRAIQVSELEERIAKLERAAEREANFERDETATLSTARKKEEENGS
jgi:hypothetical protein